MALRCAQTENFNEPIGTGAFRQPANVLGIVDYHWSRPNVPKGVAMTWPLFGVHDLMRCIETTELQHCRLVTTEQTMVNAYSCCKYKHKTNL